MASQSKDESSESEQGSDDEERGNKSDSNTEPNENPDHGSEANESAEQEKVAATGGAETNASVYTELDLTEEGTILKTFSDKYFMK